MILIKIHPGTLCKGFSFSVQSSGCILGSINLGASQKCGSPFPILHPKCWILVGKQTSFSYVPPNFETLLSQLASSSHHLDGIVFLRPVDSSYFSISKAFTLSGEVLRVSLVFLTMRLGEDLKTSTEIIYSCERLTSHF